MARQRPTGKPQSYATKGDLARRRREVLGLSQADAAGLWRVSERTIRDVETGRGASATTLRTIADKLKLSSWHELLTDEERARLNDDPVSPLAPAQPVAAPSLVLIPPAINHLYQLPAVVADFAGRADEIRRMVDRLRGEGGTIGVSALRGMGGVGKTSLAVRVAHEVKDHFPDAQLVLELHGTSDRPVTAAEAMARIIRDFHPDAAKLPDTEDELRPIYLSVLAGKRALIVLDNARDEEQVRHLVTAPPPVGVVITSRNVLALDGVESIRLDVLPLGEALALLRGIVGPKGTNDELQVVAELCGRLPLALRVAGDFLRLHANWTLSRYIEALKDERLRLERLTGKTREKDVETVLGLSAAELVRDNPQQAERWQLLSVFPADFDARAAAAVWDLMQDDESDVDAAVDDLTALLDRSLLQYDELTERYSLHDLMRPVARDAFEYDENHPLQNGSASRLQAASRRFAQLYCSVLSAAGNLYLKGNDSISQGLALFDREEGNIRRGWEWAAEHRADDAAATELCRDYPNTGAHVLGLRLSPRERVRWLVSSADACRKLGDRRGEGVTLGNLGNAHAALGDTRAAITFHEQNLMIAREVGDRRGEGIALGNLGNDYSSLGDARAAIAFHEEALAIARVIGDRRGEANALGNLGIAHKNLGDARAAIAFYEQNLAITREVGDRPGEGTTLGNLGNAHIDLGDARAAVAFHEEALAIARAIGARQGEANALGSLGNAYYSLGDTRAAIAFYEQHLAIAREVGDRRGEGATLGNLGNAHYSLGDTRVPITFYEQWLAVAREVGDRQGEGAALGNLGSAHRSLGDTRAAIIFHEQSLAIAREIGDKRIEANANWNMALTLVQIGEIPAAIPFGEQFLAYFESIGHPRVEADRKTIAGWRASTSPSNDPAPPP